MPCGEHIDLPPTNETLLIYTNGSEQQFYRMVPVPADAATVRTDGSIEYKQGDPPDIIGYDRTGLLFRPTWVSCRWRTLSVTHPNGYIAIKGRCGYPLAERHLQVITPAQCALCQKRRPING